ncbi:hypothetical protein [Vibrio tetraodonis]|uniref:hypothetical protein n=1 Tax=Vibrio tetraodonis TaxID=2231647 RepID=UPI000E0C0671|nr:hypothetical protein [Vibrio tetraodonis]
MEEHEKENIVSQLGDYILGSDFSNMSVDDSKLLMAIKHRYGVGIEKNLFKSKELLLSMEDKGSDKTKAAKYYMLGTQMYSCENGTGSEFLALANEYGDLKSTFILPFIRFYDSKFNMDISEYVKSIRESMFLGNDFSVFEYIYLQEKYNEKEKIEEWVSVFNKSTLLHDCEFYRFIKNGDGLGGLAVDWDIKKDILNRYWKYYLNKCE